MDTKEYSPLIPLPYDIDNGDSYSVPCLTHFNDNYLIISGGGGRDALRNTAIYSIADNKWLDNVPFMQEKRMFHACVVYGNYIYQIGGWNEWDYNKIGTNT
eukprot:346129_1